MHDNSYAAVSQSINEALRDKSVRYINLKQRVRAISEVSWYVAVDLKAGYRQLPLNPKD